MNAFRKFAALLPLVVSLMAAVWPATAQERRPLRIEITEGVIEPLPVAIAPFIAQGRGADRLAADIEQVVAGDLLSTGLFRLIPSTAHLTRVTAFDAPIAFGDWRAINAQALVVGMVTVSGGQVAVRFRLYDVFAGEEMGQGLQFAGPVAGWRRMGHKIADQIYGRITGEGGYFDSQVLFVEVSGPKDRRRSRLALMDQDGANLRHLTDGGDLIVAPRFSPDGRQVLYTSWATGFPRVYLMDLSSGRRRALPAQPGTMSFSPRFTPDGQRVVFSLERAGNTDLYLLELASGQFRRLTTSPGIDTAPSISPDGQWIAFESDRSGTQQIYVMPASGGQARRISFGKGRYGTPVWSPTGNHIAFTKQNAGRFHIGVMRPDGSEERLLTASFLDEGPSWSPNGRVIMFTRETPGASGAPALYTVDVTGRNLRRVPIGVAGRDPSWGPLLP